MDRVDLKHKDQDATGVVVVPESALAGTSAATEWTGVGLELESEADVVVVTVDDGVVEAALLLLLMLLLLFEFGSSLLYWPEYAEFAPFWM